LAAERFELRRQVLKASLGSSDFDAHSYVLTSQHSKVLPDFVQACLNSFFEASDGIVPCADGSAGPRSASDRRGFACTVCFACNVCFAGTVCFACTACPFGTVGS